MSEQSKGHSKGLSKSRFVVLGGRRRLRIAFPDFISPLAKDWQPVSSDQPAWVKLCNFPGQEI